MEAERQLTRHLAHSSAYGTGKTLEAFATWLNLRTGQRLSYVCGVKKHERHGRTGSGHGRAGKLLPDEVIPAGPENPLGERAIYLDWSLYRIHGTNAPNSIGRSASHGCFRMHNKHVKDLYNRVHIGAPVYVVDALTDPVPPRRENKPPPESE